jgi:hypothetical protein
MRNRIRIQQLKLMRIHADRDPDTDPDPKPWSGEQETRKLQRGAGIIPLRTTNFYSLFFLNKIKVEGVGGGGGYLELIKRQSVISRT